MANSYSPLECVDYDLFDYHQAENKLNLEDAATRVEELRRSRPNQFHKITPLNKEMTAFRIDSLSKEMIAAQFSSSLAEKWLRFVAKVRR